ncbi:MAG: GNAT family N-acetyltransferase [Pyrinomonadaceae bacterium]|nr:GNAT family N-acetyltransferase [Pyrinomonadaceae bacterium]
MKIVVDDLTGPEIYALLSEHLEDMHRDMPPESVHALDLEGLRKPDVTVWTVWENEELLGCGAIKELDPEHGEIKSMRTSSNHRRRGIGSFVLKHLIKEAKSRGYTRLSLETGSMDYFKPALNLYARFGFEYCGPFADYIEDPNSVFMKKDLSD